MNPIGNYIGQTAYCVEHTPGTDGGLREIPNAVPIFRDTEADAPTHCSVCEKLIPHALTSHGYAYVAEELANHFIDNSQGRPAILKQWWSRYGDAFNPSYKTGTSHLASVLFEAIDNAIDSWPDSDELTPKGSV